MKKTKSNNFVLAMVSVGACAATAVIAQVGGEPLCLETQFLRMACDNLAQESDPECSDVILDGDDDPVTEAAGTLGCGQKSRTSKKVKCIRAVYVYDPDNLSCNYSHVHEDEFTSNEASGDNCGAC